MSGKINPPTLVPPTYQTTLPPKKESAILTPSQTGIHTSPIHCFVPPYETIKRGASTAATTMGAIFANEVVAFPIEAARLRFLNEAVPPSIFQTISSQGLQLYKGFIAGYTYRGGSRFTALGTPQIANAMISRDLSAAENILLTAGSSTAFLVVIGNRLDTLKLKGQSAIPKESKPFTRMELQFGGFSAAWTRNTSLYVVISLSSLTLKPHHFKAVSDNPKIQYATKLAAQGVITSIAAGVTAPLQATKSMMVATRCTTGEFPGFWSTLKVAITGTATRNLVPARALAAGFGTLAFQTTIDYLKDSKA